MSGSKLDRVKNFEHVIFEPYVGPGYRDVARRILIVGETHYGEPSEEPAQSTPRVVANWTEGTWSVRYLMIAARILTGLPRHLVDRESSVHDIAFYNFVQTMMPDISIRPTWKQAEDSGPAFREVVNFLDPTHVLVTGTVPWHGLETAIGVGTSREFGGRFVQFKTLPTPSGEAVAIKIAHLSRASADAWIGPVGAFLQHEHATARPT